MNVIILDIPSNEVSIAKELGAQYCDHRNKWYVLESLASYPASRKKSYTRWKVSVEDWSEAGFQELILRQLSNDFYIQEQVPGKHIASNSTLFLDAVIKPKNTAGWKNKNIAIGIEFKNPQAVDSRQSNTYWVKQCIDYAYTNWEEYGHIPILLGPGNDKIVKQNDQFSALLGSYHVGFIEYENGLHFRMQSKRIWSEGYGVQALGKSSNLQQRFGSK